MTIERYKQKNNELVLCVGHTSHLVFFYRLKKSGVFKNYNLRLILQMQKCFDGKENIAKAMARSITENVFVLEKKYCAFYGRNLIKQAFRGFWLKRWLKKLFNKNSLLLALGNSALSTNLIMSHFDKKILFKHHNQSDLLEHRLDMFNTTLGNILNICLNLKLMKVLKIPRSGYDSRVHLNRYEGTIVKTDSTIQMDDVLNFGKISTHSNSASVCLVGIPFMFWKLSTAQQNEILSSYKSQLESVAKHSKIYYLAHPNETNLEFEMIQEFIKKKMIDVTDKYVSAEHFFIENPTLSMVISVSSYAAIYAYRANFYTKVSYKDLSLNKILINEYDDKFKTTDRCIHTSYSGTYNFPDPKENLTPLLEALGEVSCYGVNSK